jgi:hypothetical protein
MQRLKGRNIVFGALAVLACSGDPTGNESTPTVIQSNPDVVFVTQGDSQPVVVTVLDEDGNVLQAEVTASNIGSGITVRLDPTYQQVTTGKPIQRGSQFFVKGVDLAQTSFKVNALGLTKTIQVTSVPGALDAVITDSQPTLGDTVTITAPTGTFFTDSSVLTFNGAAPVVTAQDETTISFIPMANIFGPALVSHVGVTANPSLFFDLATPFNVQTDSIIDLGTAVTPTAPTLGQTVTLTLPAGLKIIPESLFASGVGADTVLRGLFIANNPLQPLSITPSADSTQITFIPPPNADSFVVVPGVIPASLAACCAGVASYPLTLSTTARVTTPIIDSFPSTASDLTPDIGQEVTLTSTDAAFTIGATASVNAGGLPATVTGQTANSITFLPSPGAIGPVIVTGVEIGGFPLELPSTAGEITVPPPLEGTGDPTTAPAIDLNTTVTDAGTFDYAAPIFGGQFGTFPARLYKVVIPADGDVTVTVNWPTDQDLGAYWFAEDGVTEPGFNPADNGGAGAHPETVTNTMPAGTYILAIVNFGEGDPPVFTVNVSE